MVNAPTFHSTRCAICATADNADLVYPANFDLNDFSREVFSARRLPDGRHYRLMRCKSCGLLRSDPVIDSESLAALYADSDFNYGSELDNIRRSYGAAIARAAAQSSKGDFLEIGCGNGFMLPEARRLGFTRVTGVEPSAPAVALAEPDVRPHLVQDIMRPGLFSADSFDFVCLFQVLDHFPDPMGVVAECFRVLRPGGLILSINHNLSAVSARLLGERSPIIDIEHTYLFSPATMRLLFSRAGFKVSHVGSFWNYYKLQYILQLIPLPKRIKSSLLALGNKTGLGRISFRVPLGNLELVAQKPLRKTDA